jgi:hypothetical protein
MIKRRLRFGGPCPQLLGTKSRDAAEDTHPQLGDSLTCQRVFLQSTYDYDTQRKFLESETVK